MLPKISAGQLQLMEMLTEVFPEDEAVYEHHVGEQLRLDIYYPKHKIGVEYHGVQHFKFSLHFHGTRAKFLEHIQRDYNKVKLCKEQNISLIVFTYKDKLTEDLVFERVLEGIRRTEIVEEKKSWEQTRKEQQRMHWKQQYGELKKRKRENRS